MRAVEPSLETNSPAWAGQPEKTVGMIQSGQEREDRMARTGQPGQDSRVRTADIGQLGQDSWDKTAIQDSQDIKAGTEALG